MKYPQLTESQLTALIGYAKDNGRTWKSKLIDDWYYARTRGELQQIRNAFGATWLLNKFRLPK